MAFLAGEMRRMSDRGLGDLQVRSNLAWHAEAGAVDRAAGNLLAKALKALDAGDQERADQFVDRALQLPFNEREEAETALLCAHMMVFSMVTEAFEASAPGDSRWLDAAEAALERCGPDSREDLLETLRIIAREYAVSPAEKRRVHQVAPGDGLVRGIGDVMASRMGAEAATVRRIVVDLLEAVRAVRDELAACDVLPQG